MGSCLLLHNILHPFLGWDCPWDLEHWPQEGSLPEDSGVAIDKHYTHGLGL